MGAIAVKPTPAAISTRSFYFFALAIFALALALRLQFISMADVTYPIQGDITQYVFYAHNLVHSGTFSSVEPGSGPILADSFRGPGYPAFLAAAMAIRPDGHWYDLAIHAQAFFGALTVLLTMGLARFWLSRPAALVAGLLTAVWPHHIAATSALLSEIVFGLLLMLALWLSALAIDRGRSPWGIAAGVTFGLAYLVNSLILIFPFAVAWLIWKKDRRVALAIAAIPLLFAGLWLTRGLALPDDRSPGRASINLVQGSWPSMHLAYAFRAKDATAARIMDEIDAESRLLSESPAEGVQRMAVRIGDAPSEYLKWYVIGKPFLLWDWDIRIGYGDVYFHTLTNSPLETNPILRGLKQLLHWLNPAIFLLSAVGAFVLARPTRLKSEPLAPVLVALLCIYLTAVHVVFQAEPRYSIPYRPFQMLLLVSVISFLLARIGQQSARVKPG